MEYIFRYTDVCAVEPRELSRVMTTSRWAPMTGSQSSSRASSWDLRKLWVPGVDGTCAGLGEPLAERQVVLSDEEPGGELVASTPNQ